MISMIFFADDYNICKYRALVWCLIDCVFPSSHIWWENWLQATTFSAAQTLTAPSTNLMHPYHLKNVEDLHCIFPFKMWSIFAVVFFSKKNHRFHVHELSICIRSNLVAVMIFWEALSISIQCTFGQIKFSGRHALWYSEKGFCMSILLSTWALRSTSTSIQIHLWFDLPCICLVVAKMFLRQAIIDEGRLHYVQSMSNQVTVSSPSLI